MRKVIISILALTFAIHLHCQSPIPVRLGIAGLSHSHVQPLLRNMKSPYFEIVGIYETNSEMASRYAKTYKFDPSLVYSSLEEMLDKTKPEGVLTFTSIYDHLKVVEACAPRGIDVMVEKPLAVSTKHSLAMKKLVDKYNILLLTNYETTWYPSNHRMFEMVAGKEAGDIRKIMVFDGHKGPREINVNPEFLEWLTDPVLNGGGAVIDFGCYGADLITWILNGEKPESVYAVLKQYKPEIYPRVDDDATIILSYPSLTGIIQASWNWPFNRKDIHVYGSTGYIFSDDAQNVRYRFSEKAPESAIKLPLRDAPFNDPFTFFSAAIRGSIKIPENDLSSLKTNLTVVEILEASIESSKTGKPVKIKVKKDN